MMKSLILSMGLVSGAMAQTYSVQSRTVDSGGGESSGGGYTIRGTVGQPEASGISVGRNYLIVAGFWGGRVGIVKVPGAPQLSLFKLVDGKARLSWSSPEGEEWFLETAGTPKEGEWKEVEKAASPFDFVPGEKRQFFRLKRRD